MSQPLLPSRERQALAEVGTTDIGPGAARAATLIFMLAICAVPVAQLASNARHADRRLLDPLPVLVAGLEEAAATAPAEGLLAANRRLLAAIDRYDSDLEEQSLLRRAVLPWGQWLLARFGGAGNEQAYLGREGWLFYRPDVDHVTGPGFLEPRVLVERARGGEAWEARPEPDPLPALVAFSRQLAERGVDLVVLPVPAKAAIQPERLSRRIGHDRAPLRNPSWGDFAARLAGAGVELFDVAPVLAEAGREEPAYLATDTHWTPAAMERVAEALAAELSPRLRAPASAPAAWTRREAAVERRGDIDVMLRLPPAHPLYPAQRVIVHPVLDAAGRLWRPQRGAPVLVLGDSYTNVFSDPSLGWGSGAGLAEQLAWSLGHPVDRLAQSAGFAYTTRRELARDLAADPSRLDGVRVLVYQFAERKLSLGDWRVVDLP